MSAALDPDTPPVGRQPVSWRVTPSKAPPPWYGTLIGAVRNDVAFEGGERFTAEQQRTMATRGMAQDVPTMLVKRQADRAELVFGSNTLPPVFAFDCPIVADEGETRRVIAPSGAVKRVFADGWAHRPYRRLRDAYGYRT